MSGLSFQRLILDLLLGVLRDSPKTNPLQLESALNDSASEIPFFLYASSVVRFEFVEDFDLNLLGYSDFMVSYVFIDVIPLLR